MKKNLTISENNLYLTSDSWITLKNIITSYNGITPKKVNFKPYECY